MDGSLAGRLAWRARRVDPDRYLASLFAAPEARAYLHALYVFNHELAHVAEIVREPLLGAIRLQWWGETAQEAARGSPRAHDAARGLAALFCERGLALAPVEAMIAARAFDSSPECFADLGALEAYLDATGGALMRLAAQILGGPDGGLREAALAYGIAGLLRSSLFHARRRKLYLPLELMGDLAPDAAFAAMANSRVTLAIARLAARAREHFQRARRTRPGKSLPAMLPAALVPLYLKRLDLKRLGRDVPIQRRQITLLAAALKGRI
ncbi:MAG: phytoene/squalene synthase family protein [Rhizomicrobium sp.]